MPLYDKMSKAGGREKWKGGGRHNPDIFGEGMVENEEESCYKSK